MEYLALMVRRVSVANLGSREKEGLRVVMG